MGSATAKRSIRDAVARKDKPGLLTGDRLTMTVENGSGDAIRIPHIQAPFPGPIGCTVKSVKLRLTQKGAASSGNRTLSLRRITEKWHEGTLTYRGKPARVSTVSDSATVNGVGSDGRVVEFDLTDDYQSFVDGEFTDWGFTLESSNGNEISFYTSEANSNKPELIVTWSNRPETPTDLIPSGGKTVSVTKPKLRWAFIDLGGDTTLGAVRVQLKSSSAGWTAANGFASPGFDSGEVAATKPQFNLADSSFSGLSSGTPQWWTAMHIDGGGLESKWSDPQQITYLALPSVTLSSPGATVNDTTFPWVWSVTTQARFQLLILDANGNELWSKIITSSSARSYTMPRGIVKKTGVTYTAVLRVWDSTTRQDLPGAPGYKEVTQSFTYADTGTTTPVSDLAVNVANDLSQVVVSFTRPTVPDQVTVWLGDYQHAVFNGADILVSGTSYQLTLFDVPPRIEHTLTVKAVVVDGSDNSKASTSNPTASVYLDPIGVRLVDTDTGEGIVLLSENGQDIVDPHMPEVSATFEPIGSPVVVQVTSVLRWFEGTVTNGILTDYGNLTARVQRDRLLAMKATPLVQKVLVWGRNAVPVYISNVDPIDDDPAVGERYRVSFTFKAAVPSPEWELT